MPNKNHCDYGGDDYNGDGRIDLFEQDADDDDMNLFASQSHGYSKRNNYNRYKKAYKDAPFAFITILVGLVIFGIMAFIDLGIGILVLFALFPVAFIVEIIAIIIIKHIKK